MTAVPSGRLTVRLLPGSYATTVKGASLPTRTAGPTVALRWPPDVPAAEDPVFGSECPGASGSEGADEEAADAGVGTGAKAVLP